MTQYTVEHFERQLELVNKKRISLYDSQDIYVVVDEDNKEDVASLLAMGKHYGVVIRLSTPEEVEHVWALEVELEYHEPDVGRPWPEDEGCIILEIKDW